MFFPLQKLKTALEAALRKQIKDRELTASFF
jgi:hypothetical protein